MLQVWPRSLSHTRSCRAPLTKPGSPLNTCSTFHARWRQRTVPNAAMSDEGPTSAPVTAVAAVDESSDTANPFTSAAVRLQELLQENDWDDQEEVRQEINSYTAEMKLTLMTNTGSVLTLMAFVTSWLCGEDPWGGFRLTSESTEAALVGVAYSLPLMMCSVLSRTAPFRTKFPIMEDLHHSQMNMAQPLVTGMNFSQLLIMAGTSVVPIMLLLLPAVHGSMMVLAQIFAADLLQPMGLQLPPALRHEVSILVPALCSAYFAAWVVTRQLGVKQSQVEAIKTALGNADRFFRHAAAEQRAACPSLRESATLEEQSQKASDAFKAVAVVWLMVQRKVAQLAYILTGLNVVYFGIIWHHTDNLATPVSAALMATMLELFLIQRGVDARRKQDS